MPTKMKTKDSLRKKKRTEDRKRQEVQGPQCSQSLNCSWFYSATSRLFAASTWTDVLLAVLKCASLLFPSIHLFNYKCVVKSRQRCFHLIKQSYICTGITTVRNKRRNAGFCFVSSLLRGKAVVSHWLGPSPERLKNNLVELIMRKSTWFHIKNQWRCYKLPKTTRDKGSMFSLLCAHNEALYIGQYIVCLLEGFILPPAVARMCCLKHCCLAVTFPRDHVWMCCYCFSQICQSDRKRPGMIIYSMSCMWMHIRCELIQINALLLGFIYELKEVREIQKYLSWWIHWVHT